MKRFVLPMLIAITGLSYIFVIPSEPFLLKLLFKLIPMWLIIVYAYFQMPQKKNAVHWLVLCGLFFCMLGDGLLVWFVIGLTAFLIGHLFYMAGFFRRWHYSPLRFWSIVPLVLYGVFMGWKLTEALRASNSGEVMIPVLFYIAVISMMTWSAIMTGKKTLLFGSLLFMASDSVLAWNMFVSKLPYASIIIMTTYYGAQFLIAHSMNTIADAQALRKEETYVEQT